MDQNVNGLQDAGEPGLPGVSVHLLTAAGTELYSTVTDANGKYAFGDLVAGSTYKVRFDQPTFYYFSEEHVGGGSNPSTDSDADSTGLTDSIVAVADLNLDSIDAGLVSAQALGISFGMTGTQTASKTTTSQGCRTCKSRSNSYLVRNAR